MAASKATETSDKADQDISWQAQKSAMTRDRILDAAINCFITLAIPTLLPPKLPVLRACLAAPCCTTSPQKKN